MTNAGSKSSGPGLSRGRKVFYTLVLVAALPLVYLFIARGMRFFRVPSNSMEPTIMVSDYLMTLREAQYGRGDVVVLRDPISDTGYLVKRIVAVEGDVVAIHGGALYLNGNYVSEPYRMEPIDYVMPKFRVKQDEVFLLGDNSNWSVDSHDWMAGDEQSDRTVPGAVPKELIVGRVHYVYLPISRTRRVASYPSRSVGEL